MGFNCDKTLLIPSLYNAEWSSTTNRSLSKYLLFPFKQIKHNSWSSYYENQHIMMAKIHRWLSKHSDKITAIFYVNLFKDFCPSLMIRFPTIKILGIAHGTASDPLEPGSSHKLSTLEKGIGNIAQIFVTSTHLEQKLLSSGISDKSCHVAGLPLEFKSLRKYVNKDENLCIFNHRLVQEKGVNRFGRIWYRITQKNPLAKCHITWPWFAPEQFEQLKKIEKTIPGLNLLGSLKSNEYYQLLEKACVGFSLSEYENFGTSYAYSIIRGICYFVPDSLSYKEVAPANLRYKTNEELVSKVCCAMADSTYREGLVAEGVMHLKKKYNVETYLKNCGFDYV